jgi:hypothetical protein
VRPDSISQTGTTTCLGRLTFIVFQQAAQPFPTAHLFLFSWDCWRCQKAAVRRKLRDRTPDPFSAFEIFDHTGSRSPTGQQAFNTFLPTSAPTLSTGLVSQSQKRTNELHCGTSKTKRTGHSSIFRAIATKILAFMKGLAKLSRYGAENGANFTFLGCSDFRFFGLLRRNSLNRHAPEFHFSGTRTVIATKSRGFLCDLTLALLVLMFLEQSPLCARILHRS